MPTLAGLFGRLAARRRPLDADWGASLESLLSSNLSRARAAWPKMAINEARFVDHMRAIATADANPAESLTTLCVEDLYLTHACLQQVPGAAEEFERRLRQVVATVGRRVRGASDLQDDIAQKVLAKYLVASENQPPALTRYQGRSPLRLFMTVSARRLALNDRRDSRTRHDLLDRMAQEVKPTPPGADELLTRGKFRKPFREALRAAISRLPPDERAVLRLHVGAGMSTRRLGTLYKVNQGTISRWLARARDAVWSDVRRDLRARLALETADVESVIRGIRGDDDISLSSVLGDGG